MAVVYSTGPIENEGPFEDPGFSPIADTVMVEILNNSNQTITATVRAFNLTRDSKDPIPVNLFFGAGAETFTVPSNGTRFVQFIIRTVPRYEVRIRTSSGSLNNNQLQRLVLPSVWGQLIGFTEPNQRVLTSELKVVATPVTQNSTSTRKIRKKRRK